MPLLPASLPLWAYLAAGAGAFAAAKLASGGAVGSGPAAPGGAPTPAAGSNAAGDLWGSWTDQGAQFGGGGQIGFLPGVTIPGDPLSDNLGGQPVAPPPPPAPATSKWWPSYLSPPPSGATGYIVVKGTYWAYRVSGSKVTSRDQKTTGGFTAYVGPYKSYSWPGHGTYVLARILTSAMAGWYVGKSGAITFIAKP